jgi:hypothetical protein
MRRLALPLTLVWLAACGPPRRLCISQMVGSIAAGAVEVRFDVYGPNVHCYLNAVDHSAGVPQASHMFGKSQRIELDVTPGTHTLVVTTFSDAAGAVPTGSSCLEQQLPAGGQLCFSLQVTPIQVGCASAGATRCIASCCDPLNGRCGAACTVACDPGWGDCNFDASDGCEVNLAQAGQKLCGNVCVSADSCCSDGDCVAAPAPSACYSGTCLAIGAACTYEEKSTATICGGTCCNSIGGTCKSDCTLTCLAQFGNCDGNVGNGCETALMSSVPNCGQCGRACVADAHVATPSCSGGTCTSTCAPGWSNCKQPAAPKPDDGCECPTPACCAATCQTVHDNGFGQQFYDCLIMYEYDRTQAEKAAAAYNPSGTVSVMTFNDPNNANSSVTAACNSTPSDCPCWVYEGTGVDVNLAGYAFRQTPGSSTSCVPPFSQAGAQKWN